MWKSLLIALLTGWRDINHFGIYNQRPVKIKLDDKSVKIAIYISYLDRFLWDEGSEIYLSLPIFRQPDDDEQEALRYSHIQTQKRVVAWKKIK